MGLFIAKVKKNVDLSDITTLLDKSTPAHILNKLEHLGMFVFESSPEVAELIEQRPRIVYVKPSTELGVIESDINSGLPSHDKKSEIKCEGIQSSTVAGEFLGKKEYYSHLELISSRDFDEKNEHEYHPVYTGKNVDCYILDTGVRHDHPLLENVSTIDNFSSGFSVSGNEDSNQDDNGHGTEIALFITGKTCGVARDVNILPLKVVSSRGTGDNIGIALAINSVIEHHINKETKKPSIINYSLGMMPSPSQPVYYPDETGDDVVTLDALKLATTFGIHVVSAAGNGFGAGSSFQGPMMSKFTNGSMNISKELSKNLDPGQGNPIVVGSTDSFSNVYGNELNVNHMSYFSNYGTGNTLNAPGKSMIIPRYDWEVDTNEIYRWRTGTSFSCPIAVGLMCLYLEENPNASPASAKEWLIQNASIGKIKNLMKPINISNCELVFERTNNHVYLNLDFKLTPQQISYSKVQLTGIDDGGEYIGFDGWYDVVGVTDKQLILDFTEPSDFNFKIKTTNGFLYFLNDTHEYTDGMMSWQNKSKNNQLIIEESLSQDEYFKIFSVDETPNLFMFSPYLKSNFSIESSDGNELDIQEGLQSDAINPIYLISDRDIGKTTLFSFMYTDKTVETHNLEFKFEKNKKYYYSIPSSDLKIISLFRGGDLSKVRDSYILESSIEFEDTLKNKCNTQQLNTIEFFETFKKDSVVKEFEFELSSTEESESNDENKIYDVIELKNSDFTNGTVRITKPGYYFLTEDVLFHPNQDNDFMPTPEQIMSGMYPMGKGGAYHLGFFAAITIECSGVVLDLNGYTIQQTKKHNLHQRFFSVIELANAPFIPSQGPHSFGDTFISADKVLITNGFIDMSSHHGIHGNLPTNLILNNLTIKNFEVAGVALNGSTNIIINDVFVEGTYIKIPILSGFSQAIFIKRHLEQIKRSSQSEMLNMPSCGHSKSNSLDVSCSKTKIVELDSKSSDEVSLDLSSGKLFLNDILEDLQKDIDHVTEMVIDNKPVDNYFANISGLYDGNMYGIVLHTAGVVVHDFLKKRDEETKGNENILVTNVDIKNITSQPLEVLGIESSEGKTQVGPFGDVFDVALSSTNDNGECIYVGNSLSNAQLFLEKYEIYTNSDDVSKLESHIINWAETGKDLASIMEVNSLFMIPNKDSMAHTMKGNIGLFISGLKNANFDKILIDKVHTKGTFQRTNQIINEDKVKKPRTFQGADCSGILITASENLKFNNINIQDIDSEVAEAKVCDSAILSGIEINGIEEMCKMETEKKNDNVIIDKIETCYIGTAINIKFDYSTTEITNAHVHVYTKTGYEKNYKITGLDGSGTHEGVLKYNRNNPPTKLIVFLSNEGWIGRTAVDKLHSLKDCTPIKVKDAVNFLSKEVSVAITYDFKSESDLVIQVKHDKTHIETKRVRGLSGTGTEELTFEVKDGKIPTKLLVFASKTGWKDKTFHVLHPLRQSKPIKLNTDDTCASNGELTVSIDHELHENIDIVLQIYQDGKYQRTTRVKGATGLGTLTKKLKYDDTSKPVKLIAFATKSNWTERIDFKKTNSVEECKSDATLNFKQDELCIFENELNTKIEYENITEETDVVVNVFSDDGYEQSIRFKKVSGNGILDKSMKLRKNFKPKRMIVFATTGGWAERTHSEKIEIIEECEVQQLKDENQGNMFAPVCPKDIRICDDGETLIRDPRNNCEFPDCEGGDVKVCTEDVMTCKNGKVVGRNPFDDCNWYSCDDVGINPPDDSDDDYIMCPMDVKYCKDGSVVSRDHTNNCEFFKCPEEYRDKDDNEDMTACTKELKPCRDGTMVGRDPYNDCKFEDCPDNDIILPPVIDDRICSADVKMCKNGFVVRRDPKNDCKWESCPPSIMNGVYLKDILVNSPHVGKSSVKILVELLEGTSRWQYEINTNEAVTVEGDTETMLLGPGIYKIKIYGINSNEEQVGRIFYEKVEIKGGGDDHDTPDPEPITPDPEEKPPVEPPYETPTPVDLDFDEVLFEQNKKTWMEFGIKNYQFTVTRSYYGPEDSWRPVRVTVENGKLVNVDFTDELVGSANPDIDQYMTLTEMFGYVWDHYKNNVVQLDIEYDEYYGFIKSTYVDVDRQIADEEMGIKITDFEVMDITIPEPPVQVECLSGMLTVNIVDTKYVFNSTEGEDEGDIGIMETQSPLNVGLNMYQLTNISMEHPIGIHTNSDDVGIMSEKLIEIKPHGDIVINVSGGSMSSPHYTFKLEDGTDISTDVYSGDFKFMKKKMYVFKNAGVSGVHPFKIGKSRDIDLDWVTGTQLDSQTSEITMKIPLDYEDNIIYYCKNHPSMTSNPFGILSKTALNGEKINFYYGDIEMCVNGDFGTTSYECYYHGYIGGENNLVFSEFCGKSLDDKDDYDDADDSSDEKKK